MDSKHSAFLTGGQTPPISSSYHAVDGDLASIGNITKYVCAWAKATGSSWLAGASNTDTRQTYVLSENTLSKVQGTDIDTDDTYQFTSIWRPLTKGDEVKDTDFKFKCERAQLSGFEPLGPFSQRYFAEGHYGGEPITVQGQFDRFDEADVQFVGYSVVEGTEDLPTPSQA
ncbi:hypothetical protein V865_007308 [Kwoniella europaea PYCC6329]|uniref:NADH:ubiquinone oxidoreductase intermediate-associated protein 30 domain-containing protein n=1 Tax=Kwoniella europaea PYCC6329 TaxID=1423913 RepID=A0AAX4KRX8_9TREE